MVPKTVKFGGLELSIGDVHGKVMVTGRKGVFSIAEFGTYIEAGQLAKALMDAMNDLADAAIDQAAREGGL